MILSHDLGTTGDKATLVSDEGRVIAAVTQRYDTQFGPQGKAEQDPADWWDAFCEATRRLLEQTDTAPASIDVVSFSGQMMGVVPLDSAREVVRPAIIWADTRSTRQTARLVERVPIERVYEITGHRLNATYSLSKLLWLRDEEPESFRRTAVSVQAKDFLVHRLTGVLATDPSDASGTNAFDQRAGRWSEEIIDAAELAHTLFPQIVPSSSVTGRITAQAARESGLLAGTAVVQGGGDGPLAALGAGVTTPDSGGYAYLGSSSWVSVSAAAPMHDPAMRSMTFNHVIPDLFVPTATMQAGGASLQWIVDVLGSDPAADYETLLAAAAAGSGASDGLFFLPHLLGERSPYWNPRARAAFLGLQRHHGRGALVRAVVEGVAFNLRSGLRAFSENGRGLGRIDVIGGAAKSPFIVQLLADVWGITVSRRDLVDEANALGAAIVGGVGVGIFDGFEVASKFSRREGDHLPDARGHADYERGYARFTDAYRRLEGWFEDLP
ncbi:xylulokinase [Microbacterium sp. PRC9]|uniref:xylulokinase n=1 Tax=Microbacterium sp. PRC9 TaxID=2962591 RepID=UPI00288168FA|nr:xylulokinase [Microbacterium sp. PRC9]MDT0144523.1 xylulokinase [Microbacterium sp. PRC9]